MPNPINTNIIIGKKYVNTSIITTLLYKKYNINTN